MSEHPEKKREFNFKQYQNAKKSRRMLVRFIIYSLVIWFILYLIMEKEKSDNKIDEDQKIEYFEIESD